jgi:L-threonylcarbamoyladenylate synthase
LPHIDVTSDLFVTTPNARQLAAAFWPGDLAMILQWSDSEVGQRHAPVGAQNALVTMDPALLGELARRSSAPVAATTANLSNADKTEAAGPAITTAEVKRFVSESGTEVTYCIDGGICPLANHLTIVDCTGPAAKIVRSGVVHDRAVYAAVAVDPQLDAS